MNIEDVYMECVDAVHECTGLDFIIPDLKIREDMRFVGAKNYEMDRAMSYDDYADFPTIYVCDTNVRDIFYHFFCHELTHHLQSENKLKQEIGGYVIKGFPFILHLDYLREYIVNEGLCNFISSEICKEKKWEHYSPKIGYFQSSLSVYSYFEIGSEFKEFLDSNNINTDFDIDRNYKDIIQYVSKLNKLFDCLYDYGYYKVNEFKNLNNYSLKDTLFKIREEGSDRVLRNAESLNTLVEAK
ncbi:hypothetical protein ACFL1H_06670 [Nanoarchaeota archaeon]